MARRQVNSSPKPPQHLSLRAKRWWAQVVSDYELQPHHLLLLTKCAESWDRAEEAREVLDREGMTYQDRFGQPKLRPEIAVERDSRLSFARLLRELCLDVDAPPEARPPRRPGT